MIKYVVAPKGVEPFNSIPPTGQTYVIQARPELSNTQYIFYFIFCIIHTVVQESENVFFSGVDAFENLLKLSRETGRYISIANICHFICGSECLIESIFSESCTQNIKKYNLLSCETCQ